MCIEYKKDPIREINKVTKYLNTHRNDPYHTGFSNSGKLITSNGKYILSYTIGIQIKRGRMFSNTNASTSSQSGSQKRYKLGKLSSSVDRKFVKSKDRSDDATAMTSNVKILIQNFLDNANQKNFGKRIYTNKRDNSLDHAHTCYTNRCFTSGKTLSPGIQLRKSYNQQKFPKMASEDGGKK